MPGTGCQISAWAWAFVAHALMTALLDTLDKLDRSDNMDMSVILDMSEILKMREVSKFYTFSVLLFIGMFIAKMENIFYRASCM